MATKTGSPISHRIVIPLALLVAMLGAIWVSPAGAVQTPQSVVVNPDPVDWTPQIQDGAVFAVIQMGSTVIVGGTFTQVRKVNNQTVLSRPYLFAYDVDTGDISTTFVPQLDQYVEGLAPGPGGDTVYVGGNFTTVNGVTRKKVVELNLADGSLVSSFKANASALVEDVVIHGPWLYVSGKFTTVNSVARSGLARVDAATGTVDSTFDLPFTNPEKGSMGVSHVDVSPDGSKLVAIGSFSQIGGLPRSQIGIINLTTSPPSVSSWQTSLTPVLLTPTTTYCSASFNTWMRDIDISPDGTYFVLGTTGAYRANRLCDTITRWDLNATGPNQQPVWTNFTGGDTSWSIATTGTAVYAGGHFRWVNNTYRGDAAGPGAVPREGIAALDPVNGLPISWDPSHERGVGSFDLTATPSGLLVGSDTDHAGNEFHQKIAMFPLAGGAALTPAVPYTLPNDLYNLDMWATGNGSLTHRSYDLSTFGTASNFATPGIDWRNARGAFALGGKLYYGMNDGRLYVRDFNGTTLGTATQLNLYGLDVQPSSSFLIPGTTTRVPALTTQVAAMTGMFYDNGRLYYTTADNRLYYRYFEPESQVIGASLYVASTGDGVPWSSIKGMTLASGKMIYATTDNKLWSVNWGGTHPTGAITQIGGPGVDSTLWASRGLFAFNEVTDTHKPSKPGTPSGTSSTFSTIDLTWGASTDNQSSTLTYRIYRDGNTMPVGQVSGGTTGTLSFTDGGLTAGSTHTYQVDAVDAANNVSDLSNVSAQITVQAPDTTAPSDPGTPSGVSNSTAGIDLSWAASTDNADTTLTYRVFRDSPSNQVGEFAGPTTGTISFSDTGLWAGSTHSYWVLAIDTAGNPSAKVASPSFQVQAGTFADDFSSGTLANWTSVTRITIDNADGSTAAPSGVGSPSAQSAFAYRDLGTSLTTACLSAQVKVGAQNGNAVDLLRLRTATGGAIVKSYVDATGKLYIRNEAASGQKASGVTLPSGWNRLELCGTVGSTGTWDLYLNGTPIVNAWAAATGTEGVGRVQIGDSASKTWTANFDDVVVDQNAG